MLKGNIILYSQYRSQLKKFDHPGSNFRHIINLLLLPLCDAYISEIPVEVYKKFLKVFVFIKVSI